MSIHKLLCFFALPAIFFSQDSTQIELSQKIGPIIDSLPVLDSLIINQKDTTNLLLKAEVNPQKTMRSYPINASGTFFRGIEMNTQGAGGLNGGLRFQVAGKLSENIQVSGTVTDESIPIQPEGTTAALDELDKVYLNVAYPAGELKHGPLALIDEDMPVIAIAPLNDLLEKLKSNIQEVKARGGQMIVFEDEDSDISSEASFEVLKLTKNVGRITAPITFNIALQLLSYHVALIKGTDVDQPRNLAKSVTVE